jgi:hypothetical protein
LNSVANFISNARFYAAKPFRGYAWESTALACALAFFVAAATYNWLARVEKAEAESEHIAAAQEAVTSKVKRGRQVDSSKVRIPDLPYFSAARFTGQFHRTADEVGLALDEVVYSLEESTGQPFIRYRITLGVHTQYSEIRRFVAALSNDLPNTSLDAVRCARSSLGSSKLSCDLVLSAFFAK